MPTIRQQRLAKEIIKNSTASAPKNKKELLVASGYTEISAESSQHDLFDRPGVQEALSDLGFSEEGAKAVVQEIMYDKKIDPGNRLRSADMMFKVHGSYASDKPENNQGTRIIVIPAELINKIQPLHELSPRTE